MNKHRKQIFIFNEANDNEWEIYKYCFTEGVLWRVIEY